MHSSAFVQPGSVAAALHTMASCYCSTGDRCYACHGGSGREMPFSIVGIRRDAALRNGSWSNVCQRQPMFSCAGRQAFSDYYQWSNWSSNCQKQISPSPTVAEVVRGWGLLLSLLPCHAFGNLGCWCSGLGGAAVSNGVYWQAPPGIQGANEYLPITHWLENMIFVWFCSTSAKGIQHFAVLQMHVCPRPENIQLMTTCKEFGLCILPGI